jgi:predicted AlkP superfamily pyrophosphatase or phosphodiesterase
MKQCLSLFILLFGLHLSSQTATVKRPKLVVGIIVDQMRWDFLYKYSNRYGKNGFNRLLSGGHSCENGYIPYAPTVTAAGHACVYTGSVPSLNGIVGNEWYDTKSNSYVYCAEDSTVNAVGNGGKSTAGKMSPRNLWTTTIGDELRIATNYKAKTVGVCIKDRGAIFPAGHSANAAYWYDGVTGKWITSSYYMNELPNWLTKMNDEQFTKKYYAKNWNTLYPKSSYTLSDADEQIYEGKFRGNPSASLPYNLDTAFNNKSLILLTPHGNSMSIEVAKGAIENHDLGKDEVTDLLALSLSTPDYIGHQFGPNSIEIEDTYLKLDQEIEQFLNYLDKNIGKSDYTIFLSADHGVAHVPGYNEKNKLPGRLAGMTKLQISTNADIEEKFGIKDAIKTEQNNQLYLNKPAIVASNHKLKDIEEYILTEWAKEPSILYIFRMAEMDKVILNQKIKTMFVNGYTPSRSGDIQIIHKSGYFDGRLTGTTHGSPYPYDSHIPVLFYGWGINPGKTYRNVYMTDIAPTVASILKIQMPSGTVGEAIPEVILPFTMTDKSQLLNQRN